MTALMMEMMDKFTSGIYSRDRWGEMYASPFLGLEFFTIKNRNENVLCHLLDAILFAVAVRIKAGRTKKS